MRTKILIFYEILHIFRRFSLPKAYQSTVKKINGYTSLSLVAQILLSVPFNQTGKMAQTRVSALPLKKLYLF
jgi:hypothetical protein